MGGKSKGRRTAAEEIAAAEQALDDLAAVEVFATNGSAVTMRELLGLGLESGQAAMGTRESAACAAETLRMTRVFSSFVSWDRARSVLAIKSRLDAAGVRLIAVGVGTAKGAAKFAEKCPFPEELCFCDPQRKAYAALALYDSVLRSMRSIPKVFCGCGGRCIGFPKGFYFVTPPSTMSTMQQGGTFVFQGRNVLYARRDEETGDHAPLEEVLAACVGPEVARQWSASLE
eukprot:jgi/Chlat1/2808/Chrsp187S02919